MQEIHHRVKNNLQTVASLLRLQARSPGADPQKALEEWRGAVSPDGYSIPTRAGGIAMVEWVRPPHFYSAGKLLVLYLGDKPRTVEGLDSVLGPQFAGS